MGISRKKAKQNERMAETEIVNNTEKKGKKKPVYKDNTQWLRSVSLMTWVERRLTTLST